ncbi:MAG TPA: hypothetical protein VJZ24_02185 [Thermodesulfovibrionales bacterium]|nr:hypothetical protein [Thermodesulfovibrionales bacterium]
MTDKDFDSIVEHRISAIREILLVKAKEYARNGDRLHNFRRAAALERCTQERALLGMLTKHIVSVYDMVDDLERGIWIRKSAWDEKIGDMINYAILLEALISERGNVKKS